MANGIDTLTQKRFDNFFLKLNRKLMMLQFKIPVNDVDYLHEETLEELTHLPQICAESTRDFLQGWAEGFYPVITRADIQMGEAYYYLVVDIANCMDFLELLRKMKLIAPKVEEDLNEAIEQIALQEVEHEEMYNTISQFLIYPEKLMPAANTQTC